MGNQQDSTNPHSSWQNGKQNSGNQDLKQQNEIKSLNQLNQATQSKSERWLGTQHQLYQFYQTENMKEWILLDNKSTTTIFYNLDMVTDIYPTNRESIILLPLPEFSDLTT